MMTPAGAPVLAVAQVGSAARRALCCSHRGSVLAVFEHSCYVALGARELICLGGPGLGAGPLNVLLASAADASRLLSRIAPFLLIGVACFFLLSRNHIGTKRPAVVGNAAFAALACLPIGFYDGFFGPGTGSMYAAAFVLLLGRELRSATADTKILNTAGSVVATAILLPSGLIVWPAALAMALGGIIGGQIGARLALRWGAPLIRRMLVLVSIALAIRLILQQYN